MSDLNYLKKELYKQNPSATLEHIKDEIITYSTELMFVDDLHIPLKGKQINVYFEIPFNESKGAIFTRVMPAKLLIRWLKNIHENIVRF